MFFRYTCELKDLAQNFQKSGDLRIDLSTPLKASITITNAYPNASPPSVASSAICVADAETDVAPEFREGVQDAVTAAHPAGQVNLGPLSPQNGPLWLAVDRVFGPLQNMAETAVSAMRWRCGLSRGAVGVIANPKEYLSLDGKHWLEIPTIRSMEIRFLGTLRPVNATPDLAASIEELVTSGIDEPLGHQMFREAWSLRVTNPRSSLVIGVAAAEVGLKKLIGIIVPESTWLLDEIQSPPFGKLLRKYVPNLKIKAHFVGKKITPPGALMNLLDDAVAYRNKVVHAGRDAPDRDKLEEMLNAVEDFLWVCDVYSGRTWVSTFISPSTFAAWENT
jgi:hypothetical protein